MRSVELDVPRRNCSRDCWEDDCRGSNPRWTMEPPPEVEDPTRRAPKDEGPVGVEHPICTPAVDEDPDCTPLMAEGCRRTKVPSAFLPSASAAGFGRDYWRVAPGTDYWHVAPDDRAAWSVLVGFISPSSGNNSLLLRRFRVDRCGCILGRSDDALEILNDLDYGATRTSARICSSGATLSSDSSLFSLACSFGNWGHHIPLQSGLPVLWS
ncbi:hypothetical protein PR202_gb17210 [Eleusine coracana subsp. coracana]|uniref:Uncharacterized protein n=1 Tax=Eleusine coracana subsp. coracana TaxID=191504 RepID=A0AAV5EZY7_ELECO|nr:hypothetical protein PR202_gb17210 [Eleusine coracana subsp. coracana]